MRSLSDFHSISDCRDFRDRDAIPALWQDAYNFFVKRTQGDSRKHINVLPCLYYSEMISPDDLREKLATRCLKIKDQFTTVLGTTDCSYDSLQLDTFGDREFCKRLALKPGVSITYSIDNPTVLPIIMGEFHALLVFARHSAGMPYKEVLIVLRNAEYFDESIIAQNNLAEHFAYAYSEENNGIDIEALTVFQVFDDVGMSKYYLLALIIGYISIPELWEKLLKLFYNSFSALQQIRFTELKKYFLKGTGIFMDEYKYLAFDMSFKWADLQVSSTDSMYASMRAQGSNKVLNFHYAYSREEVLRPSVLLLRHKVIPHGFKAKYSFTAPRGIQLMMRLPATLPSVYYLLSVANIALHRLYASKPIRDNANRPIASPLQQRRHSLTEEFYQCFINAIRKRFTFKVMLERVHCFAIAHRFRSIQLEPERVIENIGSAIFVDMMLLFIMNPLWENKMAGNLVRLISVHRIAPCVSIQTDKLEGSRAKVSVLSMLLHVFGQLNRGRVFSKGSQLLSLYESIGERPQVFSHNNHHIEFLQSKPYFYQIIPIVMDNSYFALLIRDSGLHHVLFEFLVRNVSAGGEESNEVLTPLKTSINAFRTIALAPFRPLESKEIVYASKKDAVFGMLAFVDKFISIRDKRGFLDEQMRGVDYSVNGLVKQYNANERYFEQGEEVARRVSHLLAMDNIRRLSSDSMNALHYYIDKKEIGTEQTPLQTRRAATPASSRGTIGRAFGSETARKYYWTTDYLETPFTIKFRHMRNFLLDEMKVGYFVYLFIHHVVIYDANAEANKKQIFVTEAKLSTRPEAIELIARFDSKNEGLLSTACAHFEEGGADPPNGSPCEIFVSYVQYFAKLIISRGTSILRDSRTQALYNLFVTENLLPYSIIETCQNIENYCRERLSRLKITKSREDMSYLLRVLELSGFKAVDNAQVQRWDKEIHANSAEDDDDQRKRNITKRLDFSGMDGD